MTKFEIFFNCKVSKTDWFSESIRGRQKRTSTKNREKLTQIVRTGSNPPLSVRAHYKFSVRAHYKFSKNPMFFAPKIADVRIWRTPLSAKYPYWTSPLPPDFGRLLWTAPYVY